jgi:hypothetical protein
VDEGEEEDRSPQLLRVCGEEPDDDLQLWEPPDELDRGAE